MKKLDQLVVFIVGLGQIGGSIGIDLIGKRLVAKVIGFDCNLTVTRQARRQKVIDSSVSSLEEGLRLADLVILAMPVREIIKCLPLLFRSLERSRNMAILDVGSTKVEILKAVSMVKASVNFIGGHPITGSEEYGLRAAKSGRFKNTSFVLVPSQGTKKEWLDIVASLVRCLGAKPVIMKAEKHDRIIALTSNLPYVVSLSLLHLAMKHGKKDKAFWGMVGGSFRSATRVAASSTDLTVDMLLTNRDQVSRIVEELITELQSLKEMVESKDERRLGLLVKKVQSQARQLTTGKM
ncbi:MAG: prephenate dehydrogenase [Candidatus Zixiibacteriota bacterium]